MEDVQNLLEGSRCCPTQGTLTPATGTPAQPGSPAFKGEQGREEHWTQGQAGLPLL